MWSGYQISKLSELSKWSEELYPSPDALCGYAGGEKDSLYAILAGMHKVKQHVKSWGSVPLTWVPVPLGGIPVPQCL